MASATKTPTVKQQVRKLLDQMPETCTVEDIQYQLYLIDKINRGEDSLRRDGGIPHGQIKRRFAACLTR